MPTVWRTPVQGVFSCFLHLPLLLLLRTAVAAGAAAAALLLLLLLLLLLPPLLLLLVLLGVCLFSPYSCEIIREKMYEYAKMDAAVISRAVPGNLPR